MSKRCRVVAHRSGVRAGEAIDRAIGHVLELQRSDGSFGVWNETDDTVRAGTPTPPIS